VCVCIRVCLCACVCVCVCLSVGIQMLMVHGSVLEKVCRPPEKEFSYSIYSEIGETWTWALNGQ